MADWSKIRTEYVTTNISYRDLAKKYGVDQSTIGRRSRKEGWVQERTQNAIETHSKVLEAVSASEVNRATRLQAVADRLIEKLERAVEELDITIAEETHKEKTIEYNNSERPDKPTREVINETKQIVKISTIVDRAGVKQLASALRELQEVHGIKSEADMREQEARIEALRQKANPANGLDGQKYGIVVLPPINPLTPPEEDDG